MECRARRSSEVERIGLYRSMRLHRPCWSWRGWEPLAQPELASWVAASPEAGAFGASGDTGEVAAALGGNPLLEASEEALPEGAGLTVPNRSAVQFHDGK